MTGGKPVTLSFGISSQLLHYETLDSYICTSTTSTMFPRSCFRQTHTARHQQIKRKDYPVWLLGTSWLLQEKQTSLHCPAKLCRQGSVVVWLTFMPGLSCLKNISKTFIEFCGITGCDSASLKLCIFKAAWPFGPLEPNPFSKLTVAGLLWLSEDKDSYGASSTQSRLHTSEAN